MNVLTGCVKRNGTHLWYDTAIGVFCFAAQTLRELSHSGPVPRIAVLFVMLITGSAMAREKPPIRMKMELMSIRNRSSGPLPVHIKLEYNRPQILEGDLILEIYDAVDVVSRDDLMATLRHEDIVLAGGDYEFNIVLPPLRTTVTQNWAVMASFITDQGRIQLTSLPEQPEIPEPFDLLTTSPMERSVLLCSCFKDTRRNNESANRQFLEKSLSLDNYNPHYATWDMQQTNESSPQLTGIQKLDKIGRTIIYFAGQWSSKDLPQDPLSYCAFDVVLLADESLAALQKEQLDGLLAWVRAGGSVCVVPDVSIKPFHLEFLRKLFEHGADVPANLSLDSDGRLLVVSDERDPILMGHCGLGRAVLLPAVENYSSRLGKEDLGSIVAFLWKVRRNQSIRMGENWAPADLFQQLRDRGLNVERDAEGIYSFDAGYRYYSDRQIDEKYYLDLNRVKSQFGVDDRLNPRTEPLLAFAEDALLPSDVEMVPMWIIGIILTGYVVAIGPADYFLLGWLKMRKYTWVLFPVITGVFTFLTIAVANAFMGSDDTGGKLSITDLAENGIPVRQTTLETLYYSSEVNVKSAHRGELVVLSEDNFSGPGFQDPYGQRQHAQDGPLSYSGHFPQSFSVSHRVQQWSPVSLRTLSLEPQEFRVPPIDWNDASLLTTAEGRTRLREELARYAKTQAQDSGTEASCYAMIYHEGDAPKLLGYQLPVGGRQANSDGLNGNPGTGDYHQGTAVQNMIFSIPTVKTSAANMFSVVSQIAPHGAGSLEDLAFLDSSDPAQWALVIVEQTGKDFHVYRKLYVVQP